MTTKCKIHHEDGDGISFFDGSLVESLPEVEKDQKLQGPKDMFETILNTIPYEIFRKDKDLNYLGCNNHFASSAALSKPAKIVGKNDHQLPWTKEESNFYQRCDLKVMKNDQAEYRIIETQQQKDGYTVEVRTNKTPLRNPLVGGNRYSRHL